MRVALFFANVGRGGGGPEVYEMNLIRSLAMIDKDTDYHVFCIDRHGPQKCDVQQENVRFHVLRPGVRMVSMFTDLPRLLNRYKADVVHATFIPPPFPIPNLAYTLPCTAPFEKPEFYPFMIRRRLQYFCNLGVRTSRRVLCISEHVREYIQERFKRTESHLPIVPLAASSSFRPIAQQELGKEIRGRFGFTSPYFLFSGRWEARKNVLRIIQAFAQFTKQRIAPHKLVFTGARTWAAKESQELIERLGIANEVIDLGKSSITDLPFLVAGATALVHPSLWESFGLVLLEAMQCGTPVITSKVSAMPEIAGKAAVLVDPYKVDEIADAMLQLATNSQLRAKLSCAGIERAKSFSWERTAQASLDAYKSMVLAN